MKLALLILVAGLAFGQVPTISSIVVSNVTHNSAQLRFTASPNTSWVSYLLGTVSGTYTTQTGPNYLVNTNGAGATAAFAIGGLAPSTTYYLRPTAQPNQTNQANICNANGCGATEQAFTTSADPPLPVVPTAPTVYPIPNPDTSGYTIVRMIAGGAGGECKAAATVGPVTAGDLMQTVLNEVAPPTVLEFDQQSACTVPGTLSGGHFGYSLPHKSSGSGYIVLRTKTVALGDFPPFGTRTSPTLCAKCAVFTAMVQDADWAAGGQVFSTDSAGGSQNYIIQNLWLTVDQTQTSGLWGIIVGMGSSEDADYVSDNIVLDRVVVRGGAAGTKMNAGIGMDGIHLAVANSWLDQVYSNANWAIGIWSQWGATGPYTIDNNYFSCACMTFYQEANGATSQVPASDVTITHNTFYWPQSLKNQGYFTRQQMEFKSGHRILIQGNLVDGCWAQTTICQTVNFSATNSVVPGDSVSDANVNYNLIRNAATILDCMGVRPADNSGTNGGAESTQIQRVWLQNNWGYNLGYFNNADNAVTASLVVSQLITHRSGCADFTVDHNTFGISNPQTNYSGALFGATYSVLYFVGGGSILAANFTHTNNINYISSGSSGSRIFADQPQMNASFPEAPAYNTAGTPSQIMSSWSVHTTNGTVTPAFSWAGNVNICGLTQTGANTYADLDSAGCTTLQSGMPSTGGGDTWATGNTIAARESNAGFNPATGICSGCSGAGANISTLYTTMEVVTGVTLTAGANSIQFSYTAPDTRACNVDLSSNSFSTWTRASDGGGSNPRTPLISGLLPSTTYSYRILCYFSQTSTLFSGGQVTDGLISTFSQPVAPTITSPSPIPGGTVSVSYSYQFTATGTAPITWSGTGLPSWASLSPTGLLTGTPSGAAVSTLAITASNLAGSAGPTNFSLTIVSSGTAPTITSTSPLPSGSAGTAYSYQFTANGTAPITWTATGLPGWAAVSPTGLLSGLPNVAGVSTIQATATNGTGSAGPTPFSLTIASALPALTCSPRTGITPPTATDIQLQSNMALGTTACTNSLTQTGTCTVVDVQRVINAALGQACVVGP